MCCDAYSVDMKTMIEKCLESLGPVCASPCVNMLLLLVFRSQVTA